jgi:hypothetical protein
MLREENITVRPREDNLADARRYLHRPNIAIELNGCYWLGCDVVVIWEHDVRDYPDRVRGYAPWNCFVAFNCSSSSNRTCTSLFSGVWDWISI